MQFGYPNITYWKCGQRYSSGYLINVVNPTFPNEGLPVVLLVSKMIPRLAIIKMTKDHMMKITFCDGDFWFPDQNLKL